MRIPSAALAALLAASAPPGQVADDIREATFRYMFGNNASGQQQFAQVYCLSVEGKDPSDGFMKRFSGNEPPVKKASACTASGLGVFQIGTDVRGLVFSVDSVVRRGGVRAETEGGYYEAGLSASGNTYYLERRNGEWMVVRDVRHWIS